ncbi:MAG: glycoside hydrolase family 92 protein, partial [Planctomycetota bacterium]
ANRRPRHYGAYDGQIHAGPAYTDNGFWDTHRTIMPWIAATRPRFHGEMIEGFLNAYRESGWLPKWASPGHRDCMCSTHADVVFADAIVRAVAGGPERAAFDVREAYAAIRKNAFEPGLPDGRCGRVGLAEYQRLGYVPCDTIAYSVCRTLDFAYCDASIARAAEALGHHDDARVLRKRAQNYRHIWDPSVGFMRGRHADGSWRNALHREGFDEFEWGGPYIEGGPWQHSWTVPHDPDGLAELCEGGDELRRRVVAMLDLPPSFTVGHYPGEIHEMSEMARVDFGQYAHSNQPAHGILWQVAAVGGADAVSPIIHRVCRELYRPTPDGLAGDEDNGEMSAWFLWACLGRYPLFPAAGRYAYAPPFASSMSITPDDGGDPIQIHAAAPARV